MKSTLDYYGDLSLIIGDLENFIMKYNADFSSDTAKAFQKVNSYLYNEIAKVEQEISHNLRSKK